MIATLEGRVAQKGIDGMIVLVGGVGLDVVAPYSTLDKVTGDHVFLYTRLVTREESLTLYGFATPAEREFFDYLLAVSRVGPKLAITILSTLSVDNIRAAVRDEKPEILSRVPGIGKKTGERIILELRDKLPSALDAAPIADMTSINADVIDALTALGYSIVEAQSAVQALPADAPDDEETRVFLALQSLAG